jgi:hypothetical protein
LQADSIPIVEVGEYSNQHIQACSNCIWWASPM